MSPLTSPIHPPACTCPDHSVRPSPAAGPRFRVAIVDDQTAVREALPMLLPAVEISGSYERVEDLCAGRPAADAVVMDLVPTGGGAVPSGQRADAVRAVVAAGYRVLVYTHERSAPLLVGCLGAGATGVVHKTDPLDVLGCALRAVSEGREYLTPSVPGLLDLAGRRHQLPTLTRRQQQVLAGRARGERYESIAARLFVSKKVAEEHWAAVATKFADFLQDHSPADLERLLGLDPVGLLEWTPRAS